MKSETATIKPKLPDNIVVVYENEWWTFLANADIGVSVSVPSDEQEVARVAKLLSVYTRDKDKPAYPVYDDNRNVVGCLS